MFYHNVHCHCTGIKPNNIMKLKLVTNRKNPRQGTTTQAFWPAVHWRVVQQCYAAMWSLVSQPSTEPTERLIHQQAWGHQQTAPSSSLPVGSAHHRNYPRNSRQTCHWNETKHRRKMHESTSKVDNLPVCKVSRENRVYPYQYGCSLNMQFQYKI